MKDDFRQTLANFFLVLRYALVPMSMLLLVIAQEHPNDLPPFEVFAAIYAGGGFLYWAFLEIQLAILPPPEAKPETPILLAILGAIVFGALWPLLAFTDWTNLMFGSDTSPLDSRGPQ